MRTTTTTWNWICKLDSVPVREYWLVELPRQVLLVVTPAPALWVGVLLPRAQRVCGWCGTQTTLIYFLHLFLQQDPEHSWSRAGCQGCWWRQAAVSAQAWLGLIRWVSLEATPSLSCGHNDTSPTTSSILANLDWGVLALAANFIDTFNALPCDIWQRGSECLVRAFYPLCCGF